MLYWMVDNVAVVLLLLGMVALGFGALWWVNRKRSWLIGCGVTLALMVLVFILSLVIVTDRKQIEGNIDGIRNAFNAGNTEDAAKFFDEIVTVDTRYGAITRSNKELKELAKGTMQHYGVKQVATGKVDFEELAGSKAVVNFMVQADDDMGKTGRCRMEFERNAEGKWLVKRFTVEAWLGGAKVPVLFPFGSEIK
jgi:hypothetical protein